jgi:CheY-like chemotaxis protein
MTVPGLPTICVVDDDADIRDSLRFLFEEMGYVVEEAGDGEAALALLRAVPRPRVLLLDRMMPGLDGLETLRLLFADSTMWLRTAVLLMSARADPPEGALAQLAAQATIAIILKPFHLDTLIHAVEEAQACLAERGMSPAPGSDPLSSKRYRA